MWYSKHIKKEYKREFEEWKRKELSKELEIWKKEEEERIREDAIKRSRSILTGLSIENIAPHLKEFKYDSHDTRHIGDPVDYIIFDGLSEIINGESKDLKGIIFMEVKKGNSILTKTERAVKRAIEEGRVRFEKLKGDVE
jgi:predicted Holliday junction resolvase-like endonuclease